MPTGGPSSASVGSLEEAEALLAHLEHHEDAIVPLARLHLAIGRPQLAIELVDRHLSLGGQPDFVEGPLLAVSVQAHLAGGDIDAATRCGDRLAALASAQSTPALRGLSAVASA